MDSLKEETKERRSLASRLEHFSRNITSDIVSQAPFSLAAERMTKFFLALHPQKKKKKNTNKNSSFTHTLKLLLPLIQGLKSIHIFPWMPRIIFQTLRFCFADLCYHFIGKHYTVNDHVITKKKKHLNVELYIYLCHDVIHCTINKM